MKCAISTAVCDTRKGTPHPPGAEFEKPVPGPLTHCADRNIIARVERYVEGLNVAPHDLEPSHLGAFVNRRAQRPGIDHPGGELVAGATRHQDTDRLRRDE